jgi:MFS family permease
MDCTDHDHLGLISTAFMYVDQISWGWVAQHFGCTDTEFTFYLLRFLLGAAEAGFFPGIILYLTYWFPDHRRTKMVALFMTAIAVSNLVGSPISGGIMQYMDGAGGLSGWRWLFLLEGIPSILVGVLVLMVLPNSPRMQNGSTMKNVMRFSRHLSATKPAKRLQVPSTI